MKKLINLQMFAEENTGGINNAGGQAGGEPQTTAQAVNTAEPQVNAHQAFDDFLKDKENHAEFDRRITKAVQTAVENAKRKWEVLTSSKVSEAERLAQMNAEEKAEYRAKKAEKELEDLKRTIARTELAGKARSMMADEGIIVSDAIVSALVGEDAETTKASVEGFCKAFKDSVAEAVKSALKSPTPIASASGKSYTKADIMAIKDKAERRRLIAENPQLFE